MQSRWSERTSVSTPVFASRKLKWRTSASVFSTPCKISHIRTSLVRFLTSVATSQRLQLYLWSEKTTGLHDFYIFLHFNQLFGQTSVSAAVVCFIPTYVAILRIDLWMMKELFQVVVFAYWCRARPCAVQVYVFCRWLPISILTVCVRWAWKVLNLEVNVKLRLWERDVA